MIADPDGVLESAVNHDGTRRFYPPYTHPAAHRLREELFMMRRNRDEVDRRLFGYARTDALGNADQVIAHLEREVARFEHGEDRAKIHYLIGHYRRLGLDL